MIFSILIGASIFSLIFRGVGGDLLVDQIFEMMPGGKYTALFIYSASNLPLWFYLRLY
jgi:TRAP-type mannitol/chloroaromatic compound transport system permease large subunit